MTTVFIADGHALITDCLSAAIGQEPDLTVVGTTNLTDDLVARCASLRPDVVLTSVDAPGFDGIRATQSLKQAPFTTPRILFVTADTRPGIIRRALKAGVDGYVLRSTTLRDLANTIRRVHQGALVLDPEVAKLSELVGDSPLTPRETQVLQAAMQGQTVATIAEAVLLSCGTVRNVLSAAIRKTGAVNRSEAVHIADRNGWL